MRDDIVGVEFVGVQIDWPILIGMVVTLGLAILIVVRVLRARR